MLAKLKELLQNSIGRLRIVGFLEGTSLLILLFVAMPLKYIWQQPAMVKAVGSAHGFLFLLFVGWVVYEGVARAWPFWSRTLPLIVSSFIPFGTFYLDKKILKQEMQDARR
jgi:integral membrane protein